MSRAIVSTSLVLVGLALGSILGWFAGRRSAIGTRGYKIAARAILTDPEGKPVGELAPGIVVLSSDPLDPRGDLGWWGYVPVHFGTAEEAALILRTSPDRISSPVSVSVRALLPGDVASVPAKPK